MTSDGKIVQTLIKVLRKGLDCKEKSDLSLGELNAARTVASAHGLSAIAYDGLEKALDSNPERRNEIPKTLLLQWYGLCVHQTALFKKKWKAACSLSSLLGEHGIEAVVLKGRSIAQYYPIPEHRYSCDLDLFVAIYRTYTWRPASWQADSEACGGLGGVEEAGD